MAKCAYEHLIKKNLKCPQKVRICGYYDHDSGKCTKPDIEIKEKKK